MMQKAFEPSVTAKAVADGHRTAKKYIKTQISAERSADICVLSVKIGIERWVAFILSQTRQTPYVF